MGRRNRRIRPARRRAWLRLSRTMRTASPARRGCAFKVGAYWLSRSASAASTRICGSDSKASRTIRLPTSCGAANINRPTINAAPIRPPKAAAPNDAPLPLVTFAPCRPSRGTSCPSEVPSWTPWQCPALEDSRACLGECRAVPFRHWPAPSSGRLRGCCAPPSQAARAAGRLRGHRRFRAGTRRTDSDCRG